MMVPSEPNGGQTYDDKYQHAGDRSFERELPSLRLRAGGDGSIQPRFVADAAGGAFCRATSLHRGDGGLRHVAPLGPGGATARSRGSAYSSGLREAVREAPEK